MDQADGVAESIKKTIDQYIEKHEIDAPLESPYQPVWEPNEVPRSLDLRAENIGTVIWSIGYHLNYEWLEIPVFDGKGYPGHDRGVTGVKGLYFLGLPWMYTWGSGRFSGIARDAIYLADHIQANHRLNPLSPPLFNSLAIGS